MDKKYIFFLTFILFISFPLLMFSACKNTNAKNHNIRLYNTDSQKIENINLEEYIEGVVAGEINNNSPLEALKAQAVLARSFAVYFIKNNNSKYSNADISTDINEAQAYNKININENIKKAVKETKGIILKSNNNYIKTWFHSNSGGHTTSAKNGLNIIGEEPNYLKQIKIDESDANTNNYSWSYTFSKSEILSTLRNLGINVTTINNFNKGEIDDSGRCLNFVIGGQNVNANTFRLNIGSTKFKSTLIDNIIINDSNITFNGRGYGHGVGLSQEYAIYLAKQGKSYKDIIRTFYKNIEFKSY